MFIGRRSKNVFLLIGHKDALFVKIEKEWFSSEHVRVTDYVMNVYGVRCERTRKGRLSFRFVTDTDITAFLLSAS